MTKREMEPLTVKRKVIADAHEVRYRVYRSSQDYVIVVAPSALMAVKSSGIAKPYKITRDLSVEGGAVDTKKLVDPSQVSAKATMAMSPVRQDKIQQYFTQLAEEKNGSDIDFIPMNVGDLRQKSGIHARILPPELLQEIIEEHTKHTPEMVSMHAADVNAQTPISPAPELSPAEKLVAIAQEFPSASERAPAADASAEALSPDDVKKLLDE